jgi:D-glycero-D-manno-heptose 1,7-bisphosphate phosphatase
MTGPAGVYQARPTQVVILAGGRGERLRPLTDARPKPMIEFHGKPFLQYLIEMVRESGFSRCLLLLGYMPEAIQAFFGDGRRFGIEIDYAVSAPEDDTGRRLKLAESRIDPVFLLMYCDNYWPLRFDEMWRQFTASGAPALVTVYRNRDRYTRDNLRVDSDGTVALYDRSRTAENLSGVEIGFLILKRSVLARLSDRNESFEAVVYPQLVAQRQLQAYQTDHRYYSVGSPERLSATDQFLARHPAVILDRDGVLNRRPSKAEYVCSWKDWKWLDGARESLRLFKEAGYRTIVVSNQAGIARGSMTLKDLEDIHERMKEEAREAGGAIDAVYYCPHGWDEGCECRKPKPGLLFQAQRDFSLDLTRVFYVGDDERDEQAARAAGCRWAAVSDSMPLIAVARQLLNKPA